MNHIHRQGVVFTNMAEHGCVYPAVTFYGANRSVSIEEVPSL